MCIRDRSVSVCLSVCLTLPPSLSIYFYKEISFPSALSSSSSPDSLPSALSSMLYQKCQPRWAVSARGYCKGPCNLWQLQSRHIFRRERLSSFALNPISAWLATRPQWQKLEFPPMKSSESEGFSSWPDPEQDTALINYHACSVRLC